ncbi:MAG: 5'-methylthioadenosine/adenosylhomocysteine nucleosidase [Elusimicrobia bacterium]|nr:5'-methylthioadenosine/adenosylhomocysteine nucleosidase [Elusimicrobiota bacterium]
MNIISKIAIIGAMECEISAIKKELFDLKEENYTDLKIFTGAISNKFIILAQSGVGKVNAALNAQYIIDTYKPNIIINTGVAGGISDGLDIGDVVIGTYLVQHDFDVTALGYAKGYMCTGIEKDKPTKYYCDKKLVERFQSYLEQNMPKQKIHLGIIASGDKFVSGKDSKKEINEYFGAIAVEMEGCAIAQVATRNKIPFVVTRAISDLADGKTVQYQNEFEKKMSEVSTQTIKIFLKNLQ